MKWRQTIVLLDQVYSKKSKFFFLMSSLHTYMPFLCSRFAGIGADKCTICDMRFNSNIECNEHIETHFVRLNCGACNKAVIRIGNNLYELHLAKQCNISSENIICNGNKENSNDTDLYNNKEGCCLEDKHELNRNRAEIIEVDHIEVSAETVQKIAQLLRNQIEEAETNTENESNIKKSFKNYAQIGLTRDKLTNETCEQLDSEDTHTNIIINQNVEQVTDQLLEHARFVNINDFVITDDSQSTLITENIGNITDVCTRIDQDIEELTNRNNKYIGTDNEQRTEIKNVIRPQRSRRIIQKIDTSCISEIEIINELPEELLDDEHSRNCVMRKQKRIYKYLPNKATKTVKCDLCDKWFHKERGLVLHKSLIHKTPVPTDCEICGRNFKSPSNLIQHKRTHSDEKRYKCSYCEKAFALNANLKEHLNGHTGSKPYKCEVCGRLFGRAALRIAHMRVHSGIKPFVCDINDCSRAFAYKTDLTRHRRSAHGIITKKIPCQICAKIFYENKTLQKHLQTHFKQLKRSRTS